MKSEEGEKILTEVEMQVVAIHIRGITAGHVLDKDLWMRVGEGGVV
jgi:hypothetical protein